ncbi:MAG: polymer-forming cytoskeletal protein [Lachnospiraceae bacterium]|nr:polymer-forming cytoskeletal protein [Lachnospiraceae bacterium]MCI8874043.1 polymer-forming cytoskeletal protein [Lachnospiraceae bacterium]
MSFFKDFKEDLSQAVNELLPGEEELKAAAPERPELVVNTLEQEVDVQSELKKLEGLFEKVDEVAAKQSEKPIVLTPEEPKVKAEPEKPIERAIPEPRKEVKKEIRTEEIPVKEPEHKEETIVTTKAVVNEENITNEEVNADAEKTAEAKIIAGLSAEISDEVTVITEGTSLKGDLESTGSFELRGKIEGNVRCNGKVTITGSIHGNAEASEFFADAAKVEGEISTSGTVKIGLGSVVVGNITATSAVIAGAIKGDIDVQGPVVVDTSAVVMGNIKSRSVQINNGAVIEGFCSQCYADVDMETFFDK